MTISPPRRRRSARRAERASLRFRLRAEMNGIAEAPGKVWFFELAAAVIDADRCVQCGACVAACPTDSIGIGNDDLPRPREDVHRLLAVLGLLPPGRAPLRVDLAAPGAHATASPTRAEHRTGRIPGAAEPTPAAADDWRITGVDPAPGSASSREARGETARSELGASSPGRRRRHGDPARRASRPARSTAPSSPGRTPSNPWKGDPDARDLARGDSPTPRGSFYNQTMALASLDLAAAGFGPDARIAVVGTPCEIQGIRALQARQWRRGSSRGRRGRR